MKIKCNNTGCGFCVRNNTQLKDSYICVLDDVTLHFYTEDNLDDDTVQCCSYEPRYANKLERNGETE